jgi:protein-S-isoprenylcysteine O-methyltransferase Ste14
LKAGEYFFKNRKYAPVPFFIIAVIYANPRQDLMVFGMLLILCGELIRLSAASYLGISSRLSEIKTEELVTNGPYAYVRNPIYLGNIFLYMGASIFSGALLPYLLYLTIIFFSIYYTIIIRYEESFLIDKFEKRFEPYIINVPRFFPRLSAFQERGNKRADIAVGFEAERATLVTIIAFVVLVLVSWNLQS